MQPIIAANFKANLTRKEVQTYAEQLENTMAHISAQVSIFPPVSALLTNNFKHFHIGAQNAYFAESGGFTGEICLNQLKEFGIRHILIGHSERRSLFSENQAFINQKFSFYEKAGFHIYYCIGESIQIRQKGQDSLKSFLESQLHGINTSYQHLTIAYEPIWAIGSGVSASLEQIESTHKILSNLTQAPLLYGGSVNANNAKDILSLKHVNGVLVGSASLKFESFKDIIYAATHKVS